MSSIIEGNRSRSISIGMLMRVDIGNVNSGWTEGVVTAIKKVERPDGYFHPYISGQALDTAFRDTMKVFILDNKSYENFKISPEQSGQEVENRRSSLKEILRTYVDDDLFGFMMAIKNPPKKKDNSKKPKEQKKSEPEHISTSEQIIENKDGLSLDKTQTELDNEDTPQASNDGGGGGESTRKRTSPLRVSPAFGLFRLNSDRDLGTRSAMEVKGSADAGGINI